MPVKRISILQTPEPFQIISRSGGNALFTLMHPQKPGLKTSKKNDLFLSVPCIRKEQDAKFFRGLCDNET